MKTEQYHFKAGAGASLPRLRNLSVDGFNPPHGLLVAHLAQIPLRRGQIGVSEDDLADDFQGSAGTGCVGGSMAPEIVGPQMDTDLFAGFSDHLTGGGVLDLKNPLITGKALVSDIAFQPVRHLLRNEHHL
jgi:hypothetical protein